MKKIFFLAFCFPFISFSQLPGDDLFAINQVIRVDVTFNQVGFWDSLVANYPSDTDMMAAGFQITDQNGIHTMDSIAIRLKGNSTYGHPGNKKSFKIDINQYVPGQDYDGMKKMNFNNGFKDPSFMREKVYFDLCRALGILAPRVNYANVYFNGTFWGFYIVVEQIDKQFLDWTTIDNQGNLFKAGDNSTGSTPADLMYYGQASSSYSSRYELKTNEDLNDWSDLVTLINFINNSSDADFEANFSTNINRTAFIRSMVLDNLFSNLDSYLNSGRNYYLYHNLTTGQWEWIKWDANEVFGTYSGMGGGNLEQLAPNYISSNRPLVSRMMANSSMYQEYTNYMCDMLSTYFNSAYLDAKIDEIKTLIQADVTADNNKMYTTQNFLDNANQNITVTGGGPGGSQTVYGLKSFVSAKNAYLSGVVNCTGGLNESTNSVIMASPNPFSNSFLVDNELTNIFLTDVTGKIIPIQINKSSNGKQEIVVQGNSGYYFLNFTKENQNQTIKLSKQN